MRSEPSQTYRGNFYDGESARSHDVVVRCSTTVVVISEGSDVLATWSYADLISPGPLLETRGARLTHAEAPYARLVVEKPAFSKCILERAPHLSARAHRFRGLRIVAACLAIAAVLVAVGYLFLTYAPSTFARHMPDSWRHNLGAQVKQILVRQRDECHDPDGWAALAAIRETLSEKSRNPDRFEVLVFDLSVVNAFALPGGTIVISKQLIESASGPDGVAGVLAHEMGHVIERDSEAQLVRGFGISVLQQILFGSGGFSESLGGVAGMLALMSYTRDAERRADTHAVQIMREAGVNPQGLVDFFEHIKEKSGQTDEDNRGNMLSLFNTHPGLDERLEMLEALAEWPSTPVLSAPEWAALKGICTGSATGGTQRATETVNF